MTDLPVRQQPRWWLPDLWSDLVTGFPSSLAALHPGHLIKLEDEMEDGHYVLHAELPGIDPDKDVDITVRDGRLTIKAERSERKETKGRSEFSYGSFIARSPCRRAPTRRTSRPPTTRASSPSRWVFPNRPRRPRSTSRCTPPAEPASRRPRSQPTRLRGRPYRRSGPVGDATE